MKKILVTGANGLFGEACCRIFQESSGYDVIPMTRADADLADLVSLRKYLNKLEFDVLINTAAMSGLEQCLENPVLASRVNTDAPEVMAEVCRDKGAKMIQISTDYVLDGREEVLHSDLVDFTEISTRVRTRASGVYSTTKLESEQAVLKASSSHVVARVSWLFGHGRESFVDQVVKAAHAGEIGNYVNDKFSVPNFCDDLVPAVMSIIASDTSGVFHLTNNAEPESWYTYAKKVVEIATNLGVINHCSVEINTQKLVDIQCFKEERPRFTAMLPQRLKEECHFEVENWKNGVRLYLDQKYGNSLTS